MYTDLKNIQRQNQELRASHLEELAESIVLEQAPALMFESMSDIRAERTVQLVQQIFRGEKLQRSYKKIG